MIELQNDRIGLAAIDARMATDVVEHPCPQGSRPGQLGRVRLSPVRVASLAKVGGGAVSAPPLKAVAVTVEAFDGKVVPAAPQRRSWPDFHTRSRLVGMASRGCGGGLGVRGGPSPRTHTLTDDFATPNSRAIRARDQPSSLRRRWASLRASSFLRTNICSQRDRMEHGF